MLMILQVSQLILQPTENPLTKFQLPQMLPQALYVGMHDCCLLLVTFTIGVSLKLPSRKSHAHTCYRKPAVWSWLWNCGYLCATKSSRAILQKCRWSLGVHKVESWKRFFGRVCLKIQLRWKVSKCNPPNSQKVSKSNLDLIRWLSPNMGKTWG